jgi:hypothetical protein
MANEPKPQSGNAGTGAKVGDAGHNEQGRDGGGAGERGGTREENIFDNPKRGPAETKPPPKRR